MDENTLHLFKGALHWIDKQNLFQEIRQVCQSQEERTYHFTIPIEPSDLLEMDPIIGNLVLNEPAISTKLFQEVIYIAVHTLKLLPDSVTRSQIVIHLKLKSLPTLPCYMINSTRNFVKEACSRRFYSYEGVLVGFSSTTKYTKIARYYCPDEGCDGAEGDHFIRIHIAGANEAQIVRKDFYCPYCSTKLEEDVSQRILADKVLAMFVDLDAFSWKTSCRFQSLMVTLRDDLVKSLEIGKIYKVIGTPSLDMRLGTLFLEANNILEEDMINKNMAEDKFDLLPSNIKTLFLDRKISPWSFSLGLAYAFAGDATPCGTYLHLKLGLLLSLISSYQKSKGLDILVIGSDTLQIHRLLKYAAGFADRSITHTSYDAMTASVMKDQRFDTDLYFIHGGSLLLAHGGICLVTDLNSHKKGSMEKLQKALETGKVMVDIPSKVSKQGGHQIYLPIKSSVWTFSSGHFSSHPDDNAAPKDGKFEKYGIPTALADVFGMVYCIDLESDSFAEYMTLQATILQAIGEPTIPPIQQTEFEKFLELVRSIPVELSEEAEQLIQGYYVASRHFNEGRICPQTAAQTLTTLSMSHAKLNLRQEVLEDDVVMAIWLYEESISYKSGTSQFYVRPEPHIKDNNLQEYIGEERDQRLQLFKRQLYNFLKNHSAGFDLIEE